MSDKVQFKILLVEDFDGDADIVAEFVEELGKGHYSLVRARKLSEADRLQESEQFDCVLLDLNLQDSKGLDTLYHFCQKGKGKLIPPIVILTGLDDEDTATKAMQACAHDYLVKTDINAKTLNRAIRFAVQRHSKEQMERLLAEQPLLSEVNNPGSSDEIASRGADDVKVGLDVINRLNKSNFGQVSGEGDSSRSATAPGDLQLVLQHVSVGQKAGEAVMTGLEQQVANLGRRVDLMGEAYNHLSIRVGTQERTVNNTQVAISDMRGDLRLITQQLRPMVALVEGDGKSPLVSRLESIERTIADKLEQSIDKSRLPGPGYGLLVAGWFGMAFMGVLVWLASHWYYSTHGRSADAGAQQPARSTRR